MGGHLDSSGIDDELFLEQLATIAYNWIFSGDADYRNISR